MILNAHVAQLVERILGKDEVTSSTLVVGSGLEKDSHCYLKIVRSMIFII